MSELRNGDLGWGGVMFRHELARLVIEESIVPTRSLELHAGALLASHDSHDYARLAHHAEAARDAVAVLRFAPEAARRAAAVGAHHESAEQYSRALRFAETLPASQRAELLHARAYQCMLTDQIDESVAAAHEALALWRELGDVPREAETLLLLSIVLWCPGRVTESRAAARQALEVLQGVDDDRQLAKAYARVAALSIDSEDVDSAIAFGNSALELAAAVGEEGLEIRIESMADTARYLRGEPEGRHQLERIRARAVEAGLEERVCQAADSGISFDDRGEHELKGIPGQWRLLAVDA